MYIVMSLHKIHLEILEQQGQFKGGNYRNDKILGVDILLRCFIT